MKSVNVNETKHHMISKDMDLIKTTNEGMCFGKERRILILR